MRLHRLNLLCAALVVGLTPFAAHAADAPAPAAKADKGADSAGTGSGANEEEEKAKATNKIPSLADRIKPVSGAIFDGSGRHELTPEIDISLNDPFFQKYMFGLKYDYHINSQFAVGVRGVFGVSTPSSAVNVCGTQGCSAPTLNQLATTPGNLSLIVGADFAWSPLYGKMNFFGEKVLHFDTFVVAGIDGIQYHDPSSTPVAGQSVFTPGGHIGIGQHYIFNSWFAIRADLRDYIYPGRRDVNGVPESGIENQLMLELGASFFFPLHPKSDS